MNSPSQPLVSVIVPAFDAEVTIHETLSSIRAQSYRALDIVVVDDGSTDATSLLVAQHSEQDDRVRLIQQSNAGVAAARNCGLAAARGSFVATIDADDLWRPSKIERQMRAMADNPRVGLCYTWTALLSQEGRISSLRERPDFDGDVLPELCRSNFVLGGSSPLMRAELVARIGGYDASLRARSAEGCEDWKLYLQLAETSLFAVVRDHLTGYRVSATSMSSNVPQMLRSHTLVYGEFRSKYPEYAGLMDAGRLSTMNHLLRRSLEAGDMTNGWIVFREMLRHDPRTALTRVPRFGAGYLKRRIVSKAGRSAAFLSDITPQPTSPHNRLPARSDELEAQGEVC